ncbi:hypothetical protein VSH64_16785 [Amycolatopsis rhabdoformis]|uniref:Serine/threonine protein kinase n=1 Tax=Amycolatopsis rhabdoformis TaxID=1448059 RepID=A0ABZ1IJ83_9PSEU|nr:hypothetical protein [Amycolatopsis rhabdoformis]WSE33743.1 hypothetical protein VSH64_16785 [Amycolatopsis rhabdoformis]
MTDSRPVVFETRADSGPRAPRRGRQVLGAVAGAVLAAGAAAGIVWGGTAVWSLVDPGSTADAPAPLWIPPPPLVTAVTTEPSHAEPSHPDTSRPETAGSEPGDDHGGDRDGGRGRGRGGPDH